MAIPRAGDDAHLNQFARYLHGHPDYMQWYPVQEDTKTVVLTTDADWVTCKESRRSNSGGTLQLGNHLIGAWIRVQPRIALSSGEAELYAACAEFRKLCRIVHRVDANACCAIMLRRGCGGLKHITVKIFVGPRSTSH